MANSFNLNYIGINSKKINRNLSVERLIEKTIKNSEGNIGMNGSLMVDTGSFTGRSPNDKYFVDEDSSSDNLWWGPVNRKIDKNIFNELKNKIINYYNDSNSDVFVFDGFAGADKKHSLPIRVIAKKSWQAHFSNNMFIRPNKKDLEIFSPEFTILNASDVFNEDFQNYGMNSKTFIIFNLKEKIAIIGGTEYCGEIKKGIFSVLHYYLPMKNILSMHCSANVDIEGNNPALFFGLSGTGKTTLSTDPKRLLIGDDEHGWSDDGIFNFEGGCYAKVINLSAKDEPDIFNAIKHGALVENVVFDENNKIDFTDSTKTENTRVSYPIHYIPNSLSYQGQASKSSHPNNIIFLTCDAYGVLPPISKLTLEQTMYHFISGYTAKVAGTERGISEPTATFSPCFGGPFLTLHPLRYAELLKKKMQKFNVPVYLVNTGWVGNSAQSGASRFSLPLTRQILNSILNGHIDDCQFVNDNYFGFQVPKTLGDIDPNLLNPLKAWKDVEEYHRSARELIQKFQDNYKMYDLGDENILNAGPSFT